MADPDYFNNHHQQIMHPFKGKLSGMFSAPMYFEFTDLGIDKANALHKTLTPLGISPKDIISFGGRGANIQDVVQLLNDNHVPIILITSAEHNYLHEQATHTIFMSSLENHYNKISSFSTRMSLLYILDTLYSIYFNKKYKENIDYKLTNYQKMNKQLV